MNDQISKISRRAFFKKASQGVAAVAVADGALTALTGCGSDENPVDSPCYPDYVPSPVITHETVPGENDGSIRNHYAYTVEISTSSDFSSGNTILPPHQTSPPLPPGNYYARWAATGTCPADTKFKNITIEKGVEPPPPPIDIESVEPYTVGSNQEWVEWALKPSDPNGEKMRLYDYLLRAHTYLMLHDEHDYVDEYNASKEITERNLANSNNEIERQTLQAVLDFEDWRINVKYPLEKPFSLNQDEILQVNNYLRDANPQFFIDAWSISVYNSDGSREIALGIPAYYAYANRRQETHKKILDVFERFESKLKQSGINTNNRYDVVKYVHDDVTNTLTYDSQSYPYSHNYVPRETFERRQTILGYFGDSKLSQCGGGYSKAPQYLLNRLGIPTLLQIGNLLFRNPSGNITGSGYHAWIIVQMENNEWYFMDETEDRDGGIRNFLKGRGTGGSLPGEFLYIHEIADDRVYPECTIQDYPAPVRSMQAPVRQAATALVR